MTGRDSPRLSSSTMRAPDPVAPNRLPSDPEPRPSAGPAPVHPDPSYGTGLKEFVGVLRRHWLLILLVVTASMGITGYVVYTAAPVYRATAVIRLIDQRRALTGGLEDAALERVAGVSNDPLLSEIQVLKSRAVVGRVVDRLGLRLAAADPEFRFGWLEEVHVGPDVVDGDTVRLEFGAAGVRLRTAGEDVRAPYGQPAEAGGVRVVVPRRPPVESASLSVLPREEAVDHVIGTLRVRARERTNVLDLEYAATDPVLAQRVVNAAAEVFKDANVLAAQDKSRRRREFVEEQLRRTDSIVSDAQGALSDFQSREQVFSSSEKFASEQRATLDLEVRREEMDTERRTLESLLATVQRGSPSGSQAALRALVSSPTLATSPVIQNLYSQLAQYEARRDSLTAGSEASTSTNPDVQRYESLIASTRTQVASAARSHIDQLAARIRVLDQLRARNAGKLEGLPQAQAEEARLVQNVETMRGVSEQLREEYQRARIAEAVEAGHVEIVDAAAVPRTPVSTGRGAKLALSLMLGLLLGSGGAFMIEHLTTSIRRREDIEAVLNVPSLALIPQISNGKERRRLLPFAHANGNGRGSANGAGPKGRPQAAATDLVTLADGRSAGAEAYRTLRTNLIFSQSRGPLRTVVVTSAAPGDGKTTTASNLAIAFAQHGLRAVLVDCDLRRPRVDGLFAIPKTPGLTELVLGHNTLGQVTRPGPVQGLTVIPSGTQPPNPSELLGSDAMREAAAELSAAFDVVVFDTPPLLAAADAAIVGSFADGVVLVVRAGRTERGAAQQASRQLAAVGAKLLGAVLNDPDAKMSGSGEYGYYSYYGGGEGADR